MSRLITLAGQQIAELAARCGEGGRLSRGRALYRKGAVSDLALTVGSVSATVRGSKGNRYTSTIATLVAPPSVHRQVTEAGERGVTGDDLIGEDIEVCPRDGDLGFDCECDDWGEPCKHVLAVVLALADRVDLNVDDLLMWRGLAPRPAPTTRPPAEGRKDRLTELKALLGDTAPRPTRPAAPAAGSPATIKPESPPPAQQPAMAPELAKFLGSGRTIDGPTLSNLERPPPLFDQTQVGLLADLGPELALALATIAGMLADPEKPERSDSNDQTATIKQREKDRRRR